MKAILLVLVLLTASCSSTSINAIHDKPVPECVGVKEKYGKAIVEADKQYQAAVANQESSQPDPSFIIVADAAAIAGDARAQYDHYMVKAACVD